MSPGGSRSGNRAENAETQTVVIVDDRITNLRILERLAASMDSGLSILTFDNAEAALEAMTATIPDLVITDFKMPGLDGAEFIRRIRSHPSCEDVPVILVTAYEDRDLRYRALDAGATDFLLSPVDHHEFRVRSRNLLLLRRQQLLLKQKASLLEERIQVEARAHEEALRQSHDLLLRVIDVVPVMISAVDGRGRYVFANASLRDFLGRRDEEIIGKTPDEVAPDEHGRSARRIDREMIEEGSSYRSFEEEATSAGGDRLVLLTTKSVLPGNDDTGTLVVTISLDITDRKHAERSLVAAKEMAEDASRSKTEFLANMSHELRTPLNAIIGFSQVMVDQMLGPMGTRRYVEYADDINNSAKLLLAIINDILDVSKLEAGKLELIEEVVDLRRIALDTSHLMAEQAGSRDVSILLTGFDHEIPIRGDDRMVRQILANLLTNAVEFSEAGGSVSVEAAWRDGELAVSVTDQGIGMDDREIEIAVTRFGQVESPWNRRHRGTGLGLPLAIGLVELHGGRMEIKSRKGHGTSVAVLFPAHRVVTGQPGGVP